ncbi:unnamed protein product [Cochlearia groenlandica]
MADWSKLPEELLGLIFIRLFSVVELLRVRSICKSWRSSASFIDNNPFPDNPVIHLDKVVITRVKTMAGEEIFYGLGEGDNFLSRASFFRVTLPSSSQGWLIKYESHDHNYGTFRLLNPLSREALGWWCRIIDMSKFNFSEIRRGYVVRSKEEESFGFKRLVLGRKNRILGVGCDGKIRYWNGEIWTRIRDQVARFCDIIVHKGLTYALDSKGIIWWISSSLEIYRYGPSLDENMTNYCWKDRCLVECCEEFYIVDRVIENYLRKRKYKTTNFNYTRMIHDDFGNTETRETDYHSKTIGFKVYKVDEDLGKWIEVKSLGDKAIVMATDTCFSVSAHEFYGCLQNSIYFVEQHNYKDEIKVFELDDGSIKEMSGDSKCFFKMFAPMFT